MNQQADKTALPSDFVERIRQIYPDQAAAIIQSFSLQRALVLRCNSGKTSINEAEHLLQQAGIACQALDNFPGNFLVARSQRELALNSDAYLQGYYYAQGLASQLAGLALGVEDNEEILDMCAAPGGKTAQLSGLMHGSGRIAAVEQSKARFFKLKNTIAWQQLPNVQAYHKDSIRLWRKVEARFDRVLLDAPCSSEARFDTHDGKSFQHWSMKKVQAMAKKQRALAYSAFKCLKPGGRLTYSTCSFAPEENEAVIDWLLKKFEGQLQVETLRFDLPNIQPGLTEWQGKVFNPQCELAVRVMPNELMSGFFICNLRKMIGPE